MVLFDDQQGVVIITSVPAAFVMICITHGQNSTNQNQLPGSSSTGQNAAQGSIPTNRSISASSAYQYLQNKRKKGSVMLKQGQVGLPLPSNLPGGFPQVSGLLMHDQTLPGMLKGGSGLKGPRTKRSWWQIKSTPGSMFTGVSAGLKRMRAQAKSANFMAQLNSSGGASKGEGSREDGVVAAAGLGFAIGSSSDFSKGLGSLAQGSPDYKMFSTPPPFGMQSTKKGLFMSAKQKRDKALIENEGSDTDDVQNFLDSHFSGKTPFELPQEVQDLILEREGGSGSNKAVSRAALFPGTPLMSHSLFPTQKKSSNSSLFPQIRKRNAADDISSKYGRS